MDGCLICGAQHIGSCNPRHPEHRPLSAEQWAAREARQHAAEKETTMSHGDVNESQSPAAEQTRWQTFKERAAEWFSGAEAAALKGDALCFEDFRNDAAKPQSEPAPPRETKWPILSRAGAVSPGDTIEAQRGSWFTVVEVSPEWEPPENQREIRVYGTQGEADERWQHAYCCRATLPEIHAAQKAQREQSGEERRYDLETPGPTEATGGSFQVVSTPAEAEREASRLPPGQEYRIDRAHDAGGPTDSHVVTALPSPADVARDPSVEKKIAELKDPEERAKARKLLEVIRSEVAAQERPISRERSQELELER